MSQAEVIVVYVCDECGLYFKNEEHLTTVFVNRVTDSMYANREKFDVRVRKWCDSCLRGIKEERA